ncbi:MAG TPA: AI-2E family transporter, partial [Aquihabitans sp.]|nr:AI-2E family transporter [Aquihabitans sp.]
MAAPRVDWRPHPLVQRAAVYAGCFLLVGLAVALLLEVLGRLGIVFFPVVTALFLTRVLSVPNQWLLRRGWRPAPAAGVVLVSFIALLVGAGFLIAPPMADEFSTLGDTLSEGTAEIEDWLVEDSSFDVDRRDIQDFKDDVEERGREALENSTDTIARGARLVIEILVGFVLALVLTFFGLKDGRQLHGWIVRLPTPRHRPAARAAARAAWSTLGGYIRGAALLGLLEGVIIGVVMAITGAHLVVPVMVLTFAAAFIPLVGAVVAGVIAVLVTLASAGVTEALIVAAVAILVQQFDSDLLAP